MMMNVKLPRKPQQVAGHALLLRNARTVSWRGDGSIRGAVRNQKLKKPFFLPLNLPQIVTITPDCSFWEISFGQFDSCLIPLEKNVKSRSHSRVSPPND